MGGHHLIHLHSAGRPSRTSKPASRTSPTRSAPPRPPLPGGHPLPDQRPGAAARLSHAFASRLGLPVHLDGSRLFNAAVAQGIAVREIAAYADSVSFCLSKGLCAPVGSMVAGRRNFIATVRRLRKLVGGGLRQAGVLAAAAIYALEHIVELLREDHLNAQSLAAGLAAVPGIRLDPQPPETNIVFWSLEDPDLSVAGFLKDLEAAGSRALELGRGRIRMVTHYGITAEDIGPAAEIVHRVVRRRT